MTCKRKGELVLAWLKAAPDVQKKHKQAFDEHLHTCPVCRGELASDRAIAERTPERVPLDDLMEREAGR